MKKYTKYEFIENNNNKELQELFQNPSYDQIEDLKNPKSNENGYTETLTLNIIVSIAIIGMILSFILFKVVS